MNRIILLKNKGFTLIEILIVLAIIGTAVGVGTVSFVSFNERQIVEQAANDFKNNLRITQQRALAGEKDEVICSNGGVQRNLNGWCVSPEQITFRNYRMYGTCGDPASPDGIEVFPEDDQHEIGGVPSGVTVTTTLYKSGVPTYGEGGRILFEAGSNKVYIGAPNSTGGYTKYGRIEYCFKSSFPSLPILGPGDNVYKISVRSSGEIIDTGFDQNCL